MAGLYAITFLSLAASVFAAPAYGTHSHGSVMPTGSVRSHLLPSGTRVSSGSYSHSRHSASRKSSATQEVISSADAVAKSATYVAQAAADTDCGTVTTRIAVTVTITAGETSTADVASSSIEAPTVIAQPVASAVASSGSHFYSQHHHSSSAIGKSSLVASSSSKTSPTSAAAIASSSSATYATPSSSSSVLSIDTSSLVDKQANPFTSIPAVTMPSIAITVSIPLSTTHAVAATTTSAAVVSTTSTKAAGATSTISSKRGLSYNDASLLQDFASSGKFGWTFNWGSSPGGSTYGLEFLPTLWGSADSFTNSWVANAESAIRAGASRVFSFNEPDISSQSNMTPEVAAVAYKKWVSDALSTYTNVSFCAPSVTNGDPTKGYGLGWLASFMEACTDCRIDCINIHWYGTEVSDLTSHVTQAIAQAETSGISEVWLTEFGLNNNPPASTISTFLDSALPALDATSLTGYAYFMISDGVLVTGSSPNVAGQSYMTVS